MLRWLLILLIGAVCAWLLLLAALWRWGSRFSRGSLTTDALRLLPDVLRLLKRMAGDRDLPASVRWRLGLVLAYLAFPIDLVPDVIPVIGYADDVVVVALGLRAVVRSAGEDALNRHWPGTPQGLAVVKALAGLSAGSSAEPVGPPPAPEG